MEPTTPSTRARVLYFGQQHDPGSEQAARRLRRLGFDVTDVWSAGRGAPLPPHAPSWRGDYIFHYRGYVVLPGALIDGAAVAAINFHPAPPEYPGSGCVNWALYEGAAVYGVTAHLMTERVDNRRVLECRRFPILASDDVASLLERTHLEALGLFTDVTAAVATSGTEYIERQIEKCRDERWRGTARRIWELDRLQVIEPGCPVHELERRIRAVHSDRFPLELRLYGYRFTLQR